MSGTRLNARDRLQKVAGRIADFMVAHGVAQKWERRRDLHATEDV